MKKGLLLLTLTLLTNFLSAQLTERLQDKIQQEPNATHPVSIAFTSTQSIDQLTSSSYYLNSTLAEKQKFIIKTLIEQRDKSQKDVLSYLKSQEGSVAYKSFYIVNRIVTQLSKRDILSISGMANVNVLDLASGN